MKDVNSQSAKFLRLKKLASAMGVTIIIKGEKKRYGPRLNEFLPPSNSRKLKLLFIKLEEPHYFERKLGPCGLADYVLNPLEYLGF